MSINYESLIENLKKAEKYCRNGQHLAHVLLHFSEDDLVAQFSYSLPFEELKHPRTYKND